MIEVLGHIVRGGGWATKNLGKQLPLIAAKFPEVAQCYHGSLNVRLCSPLRIEKPDFVTEPINWGQQTEVFHFTRIQFELLRSGENIIAHDAWIYGPQNSPHKKSPFLIEVITKRIELSGESRCRIRIDRNT